MSPEESSWENVRQINAAKLRKLEENLNQVDSLMFDTEGTVFSVQEFAESVGWSVPKVYSKRKAYLETGRWEKVSHGRYRWKPGYVVAVVEGEMDKWVGRYGGDK